MSSTLATMRSRIADSINRTDLNSQIDREINRAIQYYANKKNLWFTETTGTFSTVANQETYTSSDAAFIANIQEIYYMKLILASTNHQELEPRSIEWIQEMNVGRATGYPSDYALFENKIYLYLIPNAVNTITIYYSKTYADLSLDADTNDFLSYAEDLIESRATWGILYKILKNYDAAGITKAAEIDYLSALESIDENKKSTNQIEPSGW